MNQMVVSQQTGYARNASESAYPNLWRGLVGWWLPSVNPRGGNRLFDLSPFRNHGTLQNMANDDWVVSGGAGSLDFDGSDDYVSIPQRSSINVGAGNFSVSFWYRAASWVDSTPIIFKGGNLTSNPGWTLRQVSTGLQFLLRTATGTSAVIYTNTNLNEWIHVVGVFSIGVKTEIFAQGFLAATAANSFTSVANTLDIEIAKGLDSQAIPDTKYYSGMVDDIRIYNRALTPSEIRQLASRRGIGLQPRPKQFTYYQFPSGSKRRRLLTGMP